MSAQKFQVKLEKETHSEATSFVVPFNGQKVFGTRAQVKKCAGRLTVIPSAVPSRQSDFKEALEKAGVKEMFDKTSYTNRKEYAQWVESAKKPETRVSRIERAVDRISKGIKFS